MSERTPNDVEAGELIRPDADAHLEVDVDAPVVTKKPRRLLAWVVGVVLTLLYVLLIVNAVGNLTGLQTMSASLGLSLNQNGWFWLTLGIVLPAVVYAVATLAGRKRSPGARLLLLLLGIAVISAIQLEILHLIPQVSYFS